MAIHGSHGGGGEEGQGERRRESRRQLFSSVTSVTSDDDDVEEEERDVQGPEKGGMTSASSGMGARAGFVSSSSGVSQRAHKEQEEDEDKIEEEVEYHNEVEDEEEEDEQEVSFVDVLKDREASTADGVEDDEEEVEGPRYGGKDVQLERNQGAHVFETGKAQIPAYNAHLATLPSASAFRRPPHITENTRILSVRVHSASGSISDRDTDPDLPNSSPVVRASLIDAATDAFPQTLTSTSMTTVPASAASSSSGCVYMTPPANTSTTPVPVPVWEDEMVFDVDVSQLATSSSSPSLVLLLELMQPPESFKHFHAHRGNFTYGGFHRIAWAFMMLQPGDLLTSSASATTTGRGLAYDGKRVRLQFYSYMRDARASRGVSPSPSSSSSSLCGAYQSWKLMMRQRRWRWRKSGSDTIDVTLRAIPRPASKLVMGGVGDYATSGSEKGLMKLPTRSMLPMHTEVGRVPFDEMTNARFGAGGDGRGGPGGDRRGSGATSSSRRECYRDPKQPCLVPNVLDYRIEAGSRGCCAVRYSNGGDFLAAVFAGDSHNLGGGSSASSGGTSSRVLLFNTANYSTMATFTGHHELVYEVNWDAYDSEFVTSSADFTAKIWTTHTAAARSSSSLADAVDGRKTADDDDGSLIPLPPVVTLQHPCFVYTACFHPRNPPPPAANLGASNGNQQPRIVITGAYDRTVRLWNRDTGVILCELSGFEGCINAIVTDGFGKRLYVGDGGGAVVECACKVHDDGRGVELSVLRTCTELLGQPIASIKMHGRGRRLLILTKGTSTSSSMGGSSGYGSSDTSTTTLSSGSGGGGGTSTTAYSHVSRGGCRLVGLDLTIFAVEAHLRPPLCGAYPIRMEMSPDGRLLVCGSEDGRTLMWSLEQNKVHEMRHIRIHNETVVQMAWHPKEHRVAACAFGAALPLCIFCYQARSPVPSDAQVLRSGLIGTNTILPSSSSSMISQKNVTKADAGIAGVSSGTMGGKASSRPLMLTNRRALALQTAGYSAEEAAASSPSKDKERGGGGSASARDSTTRDEWSLPPDQLPDHLTPHAVSQLVQRATSRPSSRATARLKPLPQR